MDLTADAAAGYSPSLVGLIGVQRETIVEMLRRPMSSSGGILRVPMCLIFVRTHRRQVLYGDCRQSSKPIFHDYAIKVSDHLPWRSRGNLGVSITGEHRPRLFRINPNLRLSSDPDQHRRTDLGCSSMQPHLFGVVGAANERTGDDLSEAHCLADLAVPGKHDGVHIAGHGQLAFGRLEVLADGQDIAPPRAGRASSRSLHRRFRPAPPSSPDLVVSPRRFAQATTARDRR